MTGHRPLSGLLVNLKAILFDLDGTLRHDQPLPEQALYDYTVNLGVADGAEKRRRAARWAHYYWAQSPELIQDIEAFGGLNDPFWLNYAMRSLLIFDCSEACARQLAPQVKHFMREVYHPEDVVAEGAFAVLGALKTAGYRLAVLSNRQKPCHDHLASLGLLPFFDLALVAVEVDAWKPDPLFFQRALERLGTPPERALYIGDNYYADVLGAQNAGIQPVLFDPLDLFPEADCPVIHCFGDLPSLLNQEKQ
jgi:HAD superfamily hydrolase (TIGR01509 family)